MSLTAQEIEKRGRYLELVHKTKNVVSKWIDFIVCDTYQYRYHSEPNPFQLFCLVKNRSDDDYLLEIDGVYGHHLVCYPIESVKVTIKARSVTVVKLPLGDVSNGLDPREYDFLCSLLTCKLNVRSNHYSGTRELYVPVEDCEEYLVNSHKVMRFL